MFKCIVQKVWAIWITFSIMVRNFFNMILILWYSTLCENRTLRNSLDDVTNLVLTSCLISAYLKLVSLYNLPLKFGAQTGSSSCTEVYYIHDKITR